MGPGRQKAALRGRTLFLIMWSPGWELGLPSGNSSEGGALQRIYVPALWLPFLLTEGVQG